jgi:hypothetical protein
MSGKPLLLRGDRTDQGIWARRGIVCWGQRGIHTPWSSPSKTHDSSADPDLLCSRLFKAALHALVADELTFDGPEDLTHNTTAKTGFYTSRSGRPDLLYSTRGPKLLTTPSPRIVGIPR